jgi:hypothetical protein
MEGSFLNGFYIFSHLLITFLHSSFGRSPIISDESLMEVKNE